LDLKAEKRRWKAETLGDEELVDLTLQLQTLTEITTQVLWNQKQASYQLSNETTAGHNLQPTQAWSHSQPDQ
jgi:hypothetical protein